MSHVEQNIDLKAIGRAAKVSSRILAVQSTARKNEALQQIADEIEFNSARILENNALDIADGKKNGLSEALLDRLLLNDSRIAALAADTRKVAELDDPVGTEIDSRRLPNGLKLSRRRVPIGVLGVIYEARPNVTIDIAALSLKTGNAVILRGGRETLRSNLILVEAIQNALQKVDFPETCVQYIESTDRALVTELLRMDEYVDMIIPRGGAGLHKLCREKSTIPVITGGIGICHIYVDDEVTIGRAVEVVENSKVKRPSVCNAVDTLLVHQRIAGHFLPAVADRLAPARVKLYAEPRALRILRSAGAGVTEAGPDDFDREWLSLTLGIRVVDDLSEAINHIQQHSTEHSDAILTDNSEHASTFVRAVNSACVYVNASTYFTDGAQFGLGAEVAVSTQKLHARGPMGLQELTTYKWIGEGDYLIRS